jgi:hypothetical protein
MSLTATVAALGVSASIAAFLDWGAVRRLIYFSASDTLMRMFDGDERRAEMARQRNPWEPRGSSNYIVIVPGGRVEHRIFTEAEAREISWRRSRIVFGSQAPWIFALLLLQVGLVLATVGAYRIGGWPEWIGRGEGAVLSGSQILLAAFPRVAALSICWIPLAALAPTVWLTWGLVSHATRVPSWVSYAPWMDYPIWAGALAAYALTTAWVVKGFVAKAARDAPLDAMIRCAHCNYLLRPEQAGRCPECGLVRNSRHRPRFSLTHWGASVTQCRWQRALIRFLLVLLVGGLYSTPLLVTVVRRVFSS